MSIIWFYVVSCIYQDCPSALRGRSFDTGHSIQTFSQIFFICSMLISRVPDQNGVSQARYIVEIYHSGWEPLIYTFDLYCFITLSEMLTLAGDHKVKGKQNMLI